MFSMLRVHKAHSETIFTGNGDSHSLLFLLSRMVTIFLTRTYVCVVYVCTCVVFSFDREGLYIWDSSFQNATFPKSQ